MKSDYRTGAHTKHRLLFHLVFIPKYRKRVLHYQIAKRLQGLIYQACEINDWGIEKLEILPDHVHLLIQLNPKDSVSYAMQIIKGGSSKVIREEFPELEEFLWGDSFWADGFFAETVGRTTETAIRQYLDNQQNKQQGQTHGL